LWTFGIKFSLTVERTVFKSTTVSVVFTDIHYIFFGSDDVDVKGKIANVEELPLASAS